MVVPDYCYSCSVTDASGVLSVCAACGNELCIAPGTVLFGAMNDYTINGFIGKGGMGIVYEAANSKTANIVAIKHMIDAPDPTIQAENLKRFKLEADIQQQINSLYFPKGYGYFEQDNLHFMAMEYVSGEDLSKVMQNYPGKKLPETEVLEIGVQLCEAINVMHDHKDTFGQSAPLLHRDIKPDNIHRLAGSNKIMVLDFGIARPEKQSQATMLRVTSIGTREYVSLEQFLGNPVRQSDQYSIAATLYRLVTGKYLPDDFDDRVNAVSNLSKSWQPIFRKVLNKDPKLRYHSVMAFGQELANLLPHGMRPASFAAMSISNPTKNPILNPIVQSNPTPSPTPTSNSQTSSPVTSAPLQPVIQVVIRRSGANMINAGEYQEAIGGRILENGKPLGGVNIIPILMDMGGIGAATGNPGKTVQTSINGDFDLSIGDLIVPVTAGKRQVELVIEDPNTGAELCREILIINRPFSAGYSKVVRGFFGSLIAPFQWLKKKYQNRQYVKQSMQQANLLAQQSLAPIQTQYQSAQANANVIVQQAKQNARQQLAQQNIVAQQSPDYVSFGQHLWNFVRVLILLSSVGAMGYFIYQMYITVDWKTWGLFAVKAIVVIFGITFMLYLIPKIYRLGKRKHWGTAIKSWFTSLWGIISMTPMVVKAFIGGGLIVTIIIGFALQQNFLILAPLAIIPLLGGLKFNLWLIVRLSVSIFFAGITIAVCLKDIQLWLKWLGGQ